MKRLRNLSVIVMAFLAGVSAHLLYRRWDPAESQRQYRIASTETASGENQNRDFPVTFVPTAGAPAENRSVELATVLARDIGKVRSLAGQQARIRGRVFRVGHSAKSNTYFLDFGPSREALTAVIFASAVELFEKKLQAPTKFANREVEIVGFIKDHPQYGLEVILEHPEQIRILN